MVIDPRTVTGIMALVAEREREVASRYPKENDYIVDLVNVHVVDVQIALRTALEHEVDKGGDRGWPRSARESPDDQERRVLGLQTRTCSPHSHGDQAATATAFCSTRRGASSTETCSATIRAVAADSVQPRWPWPVL